jgi:hypothetical protein
MNVVPSKGCSPRAEYSEVLALSGPTADRGKSEETE